MAKWMSLPIVGPEAFDPARLWGAGKVNINVNGTKGKGE